MNELMNEDVDRTDVGPGEPRYTPITWKQIVEWIGVWIFILFLSGLLILLMFVLGNAGG